MSYVSSTVPWPSASIHFGELGDCSSRLDCRCLRWCLPVHSSKHQRSKRDYSQFPVLWHVRTPDLVSSASNCSYWVHRPGNHSVTQSTFNDPCTPVNGGFDSGWVFLPSAGLSPVPEWNLTITDDSRREFLFFPHSCLHQWVNGVPLQLSGSSVNSCCQHPTA